MSRALAANEILLRQILLEDGQAVDPSASGFAAPIGSMFVEHGVYPTTPTDTWLKSGAGDTDWLKQNLTGVRTFNVKDPAYGAVGDGVTDDLIPINLAIAACQAAGGGIVYFPPGTYKVTKNAIPSGLAEYVSFYMDNARNITFMGDGNASTVSFVDNTGGVFWDGFYGRNGTSMITFRDLNVIGTGMNTSPANNALIQFTSQAPDTTLGMRDISVSGCSIGPSTGIVLFVDNTDLAHQITNIRVVDSSVDGTSSIGASGVSIVNFMDHILVQRNYGVGGAAQVNAGIFRIGVNGTANTAWDWNVTSNHVVRADNPGSVAAISSDGGFQTHNTVTTANSELSCGPSSQPYRLVRGNVVVQTGADAQPIIRVGQPAASGITISAYGNVACRQDASGVPTAAMLISNAFSQNTTMVMSNNIVECGGTAALAQFQCSGSQNSASVTFDGNIAMYTGTLTGNGSGFSSSTVNANTCAASVAVGNMVLVVAGNTPLDGFNMRAGTAGFSTRLLNVQQNLIAGTNRLSNFNNGNRTEWIGIGLNNHTPLNSTADVSNPAGATGCTAMANAGASPQGMVSSGTMAGTVPAPKGSFGCNTVGTQGTAVFYKQTDDGTPAGGTAGWFGICGYELTFGTLAGSTTATALFYAGGMGLASPSATEIQYPMPRPGTLRNLRFRCVAGTGGGTCTFVVRKNGVNTAITIAPLNTATSASDTTNSATVVRGDLISFQVTKSGTITTAQTLARAVLELAS